MTALRMFFGCGFFAVFVKYDREAFPFILLRRAIVSLLGVCDSRWCHWA